MLVKNLFVSGKAFDTIVEAEHGVQPLDKVYV
jgi:hypothetical protein